MGPGVFLLGLLDLLSSDEEDIDSVEKVVRENGYDWDDIREDPYLAEELGLDIEQLRERADSE